MNTYYLCHTDETELKTALDAEGYCITDPEDNSKPAEYYGTCANGVILDWIGEKQAPTGNTLTDDDGIEYPEYAGTGQFLINIYSPSALPA